MIRREENFSRNTTMVTRVQSRDKRHPNSSHPHPHLHPQPGRKGYPTVGSMSSKEHQSWQKKETVTLVCSGCQVSNHGSTAVTTHVQSEKLLSNAMKTPTVISKSAQKTYPYSPDILLIRGIVILREPLRALKGAKLLQEITATWKYFFAEILPSLSVCCHWHCAEIYEMRPLYSYS